MIAGEVVFQKMDINELIDIIAEEKRKRDFMHETTPENTALLHKMCDGTFEAVVTGNGEEKCLVPQVGTLYFLYRGQNTEVVPCIPSLYRGNPSEVEIFIERMRLVVFRRLLNSHPVIEHFFKRHHFKVDDEGLAQHYGLKTEVLDLTSNLDVALFFATCWYDSARDRYCYYDDGQEHEAILYVFNPILDNEPTPSLREENYMNHSIRPIGLQVFPRPGVQEGYGLHIPIGESVKCYMYRFTFTCEDSKRYYEKFKNGDALWVKDKFVAKVASIAKQESFSFKVFEDTFREFRPKGYSATRLKKALRNYIVLKKTVDDVLFDEEERAEIIENWNNEGGKVFAEKIYRKSWFEHDELKDDGTGKEQIVGIKDKHDYRSLSRISVIQMLILLSCPDALKAAEWKNYTGKPRPQEKPSKDDGKWKEFPASMEEIFGKPYLKEKDWKIPKQ